MVAVTEGGVVSLIGGTARNLEAIALGRKKVELLSFLLSLLLYQGSSNNNEPQNGTPPVTTVGHVTYRGHSHTHVYTHTHVPFLRTWYVE